MLLERHLRVLRDRRHRANVRAVVAVVETHRSAEAQQLVALVEAGDMDARVAQPPDIAVRQALASDVVVVGGASFCATDSQGM